MQGKSLSLICGALRWLLDHEEQERLKVEAVLSGSLSPSALEDQCGGSESTPATTTTQAEAAGITKHSLHIV